MDNDIKLWGAGSVHNGRDIVREYREARRAARLDRVFNALLPVFTIALLLGLCLALHAGVALVG